MSLVTQAYQAQKGNVIHRVKLSIKDGNIVLLHRSLITSNLSDKAYRIFTYILSLKEESDNGWDLNYTDLASKFNVTEKTIAGYISELKTKGYLKVSQKRNKKNGQYSTESKYITNQLPIEDLKKFTVTPFNRQPSNVGLNNDQSDYSLTENNHDDNKKIAETNSWGIFSGDERVKELKPFLQSHGMLIEKIDNLLQKFGINLAYKEYKKLLIKQADGLVITSFPGLLKHNLEKTQKAILKRIQKKQVAQLEVKTDDKTPESIVTPEINNSSQELIIADNKKYRDMFGLAFSYYPDEENLNKETASKICDEDIKRKFLDKWEYLPAEIEKLKSTCDIDADLDLPFYQSIKNELKGLV